MPYLNGSSVMDAVQVQELMFQAILHNDKWGDTELDNWDDWSEITSPLAVEGLGHVHVAESFGGEGQGDEYWIVFKVELYPSGQEVKYYRVDGYYASYDGGYYDGELYEVKPVQKMITVYEAVKA